jgi:hypothetical protein
MARKAFVFNETLREKVPHLAGVGVRQDDILQTDDVFRGGRDGNSGRLLWGTSRRTPERTRSQNRPRAAGGRAGTALQARLELLIDTGALPAAPATRARSFWVMAEAGFMRTTLHNFLWV